MKVHSTLTKGGNLLLLVGIVALSYAATSWLGSHWNQRLLQQQFERGLQESPTFDNASAAAVRNPNATGRPESGQILGRLEIAHLDIDVIVLEGTTSAILDEGAGHIPSTAVPGTSGNIGIAAHRDTFFRGLGDIKVADEIEFTGTDGRTLRYQVEATRTVRPDEVHVLDDRGYSLLTLVTCYPFDFVGTAPERFIVHARRLPGNGE